MCYVRRLTIIFLGICTLLFGGDPPSRSSSATDTEKSRQDERPYAKKQWSASLGVSYNLLNGKEREHEIVQGNNYLDVLGITEDECPIVAAHFGTFNLTFTLEVYLNPKATLKGYLFRNLVEDTVGTPKVFTNLKGWKSEQTWKVVSGEAPSKEERLWNGVYRTDGEHIYFDATNKNGSLCTWMLVTKAPRKSRKDSP